MQPRIVFFAFFALFAMALALATGCSVSSRVTPPRSAWEQILSTQAIDRALSQIDWPEVEGQSIVVLLGAPNEGEMAPSDREYLLRSVQVALSERGAVIVADVDRADRALSVLVGAIGLNIGGRFFGVQGTNGGFFPITIPELAIYKRTRREAFARTKVVLSDHKRGGVLHSSGPVQGSAQRTTTTVLFVIDWVRTDLTPLDTPDDKPLDKPLEAPSDTPLDERVDSPPGEQ